MDTYLRSKYLARLSQHQSMLKTRINPEKYWDFVEHLKDYFIITGLDVELRQDRYIITGKTYFKLNLEIYYEKNEQINYKMMKKIFQLYFYEPHDVHYGQDFMFITMQPDRIPNLNPSQIPSSLQARTALDTSKHF